MKLPKEPVPFHFCLKPLAKISHTTSPRVKRQREALPWGEVMPRLGCQGTYQPIQHEKNDSAPFNREVKLFPPLSLLH